MNLIFTLARVARSHKNVCCIPGIEPKPHDM